MQKILIVEDEQDIVDLIRFNLERKGYEVHIALDGISGTEIALDKRPDLIVLDLMLPGRNGLAVFKILQRDPRTAHIPVMMLTARAQTEDKIFGLEAGAADYLTKPFSPKELVLRVGAILKRADSTPAANEYEFGPFRFDKSAVRFYVENEPVDLTATEFKVLLYLCERPNKPHDRNELLRVVWGYSDDVHSRTLDTHMKRLRQKLEGHGTVIQTIRGVGYQASLSEDE